MTTTATTKTARPTTMTSTTKTPTTTATTTTTTKTNTTTRATRMTRTMATRTVSQQITRLERITGLRINGSKRVKTYQNGSKRVRTRQNRLKGLAATKAWRFGHGLPTLLWFLGIPIAFSRWSQSCRISLAVISKASRIARLAHIATAGSLQRSSCQQGLYGARAYPSRCSR